jgi:preprotein translocase subunit SecE
MGATKLATRVASAASGDSGRGPLGFLDRTKRFLEDVRTEMRKVTTPSAKEVRATTTVVIVTVFIFALYFFIVDRVMGYGIDKLLHWARSL